MSQRPIPTYKLVSVPQRQPVPISSKSSSNGPCMANKCKSDTPKTFCVKGDKGQKGDNGVGSGFQRTIVSAKNPNNILPIPTNNGFLPFSLFSLDEQVLVNWTPLVNDLLGSFDAASGVYTVPESGDYRVSVVLTYRINSSISVDENLHHIPYAELFDYNTDAHILGAEFSTYSICIPIHSSDVCDIRVTGLLVRSQVFIFGDIPLIAGQQLAIKVKLNGLVSGPIDNTLIPSDIEITFPFGNNNNTGPENTIDTTFSIEKVRNSNGSVIFV